MTEQRSIEYNLTECEFISGISRATLTNHIHSGRLDAHKHYNGRWHVNHDDLVDYCNRQWTRGRLWMNLPVPREHFIEVIQYKQRKVKKHESQ